jgi:hypothetical protein
MVVLTDEEKRSILLRAQAMSVGNKGSERNCQEVLAALMIVEKTLGKQWYLKATKGLEIKIPESIPSTHDHLLKEDTRPPLTRLLIGGAPSNIAQIIQFATYIQELSPSTNVQEKLNDYVNQEKRIDLSYAHFTRLIFELKMADVYRRRGLGIHFIPKQKGVTPDFEVSSPLGSTFVECKRKDIEVKLQKELNNIYTQIVVEIKNDMSQLKCNYSIKVIIDRETKAEDIKPAIQMAHEGLIQNQKHFKANHDAITVEGERLAEIDVVHSSRDIIEPTGETLRTTVPSFECQIQPIPIPDFMNLQSLQKANLPIRNFRVVSIYSPFYASIVESSLHSIRDASTQLFESSGYGCIGIEISYSNSIATSEPEVKRVAESIPTLLETTPHISAVFLFLEEVADEAGKTHRRTRCLRFFNPSTSHKLLADIEQVMATDVSLPHASLLD